MSHKPYRKEKVMHLSKTSRRNTLILLVGTLALLWASPLLAQDGETPKKPAAEAPKEAAETPKEATDAPKETGQTAKTEDKDAEKPPEAKKPEPPTLKPGKASPSKISVPKGADPSLVKEIEAFQKDYARYSKEIKDYRKEVNVIVKNEYQNRRVEIEKVYDTEIKSLEFYERERREEAIAAFEEFLRKYPNKPGYTPDVLYRLAELYFEKANDDYLLADEHFQEKLDLYDQGRIPDPPEAPTRNYDKTISLFQRLITDFSDYRYVDGAYYLLGYCLASAQKEEESLQAFRNLIQAVPGSRFVPESWVRIGEHHFDYNELAEAISAYSNALKYPDNTFYDKALYKLAWSYYRSDRFIDAIQAFKDLVKYADDKKSKTGKSGSDLREEAIQYLAISLAEEDWNNDGLPDEDFGLARVQQFLTGEEPYEHEVLVKLAEILFDNTRYEQSILVFRMALDKYPLAAENPKYHDKMIIALERLRRFEEAVEERRRIGIYYGPDSEWYKHHQKEGNQEALAYADGLAKDNLIDSANWYHKQAQKLLEEAINSQDQRKEQEARERFALAASAYEKYLEQYPHDKDAYLLQYYLAECFFYSAQFEKASETYASVRELNVGKNEYREPAAFNAIKALEFLVTLKIQEGEIPPEALPNGLQSEEEGEGGRDAAKGAIEPVEIPELVNKLNKERMRYVELGFKNERDAQLAGKFEFQAARVYYDFYQLDEARKRFEQIINRYEDEDVAVYAATLILQSYLLVEDYENMALWADKISKNPKLANSAKAQEVRKEAERLKLGALFKNADELMDAEKYEKAAEAYIKVVQANPQNEYADDALNNAAVAYERVKRYESALNLYNRVVQEYPDSELAPVALFRVAFNAERFFDYDKAVRSYLLLVDRYKDSGDREKSLRRAGVILENLQDYDQAAQIYLRFVNEFPQSKDAPAALYQAVLVHEKRGDVRSMIRTIDQFKNAYGGDPKHNLEVMEGLDKVATYHWKKRDTRAAQGQFQKILKEYAVRGIEPGTPSARFAAKAQFHLAEIKFLEWDKITISGNLKAQEKVLKKKFADANALRPEFEKVYEFRDLEWIMAAGYRSANILQRFAQSLYDADIPFEEGSDEYYLYQTQLEDLAVPLEDRAVEDYQKAMTRAQEAKIVNEWTKKILSELNKYKPSEYPLFHEEKGEMSPFVWSPIPPLMPGGLNAPEEPEGEEAPGEEEAPGFEEEGPGEEETPGFEEEEPGEEEDPGAEEDPGEEEEGPDEPSLPTLIDDK